MYAALWWRLATLAQLLIRVCLPPVRVRVFVCACVQTVVLAVHQAHALRYCIRNVHQPDEQPSWRLGTGGFQRPEVATHQHIVRERARGKWRKAGCASWPGS